MYLDNNQIESMGFIKNMLKLTVLDCSGNNLTEIPEIPLSLIDLNLARNQIRKINKFCEAQHSAITDLDLSCNRIESIENIEDIASLETLVLCSCLTYTDSNRIKKIEGLLIMSKGCRWAVDFRIFFLQSNFQNIKSEPLQKSEGFDVQ